MKKTYIAILTAAAGLCSCIEMMDSASQADVVNPLNVSFKVKAVTGFVDADGNGTINTDFPVDGLTVRFTNFEEDAVIETLTDENGIAQTEVAPGNYTISVFGESESEGNTYYLNGSVQNKAITKDITPEQAEASNDFSIAIRPAMVGPLCFSQIFYCGSTNPVTQATYFRDQFYEIYNNGDETYYLDHLCFARLVPEFATATLPEWPAEDGLNNYVYAVTVWQLPGNGTDYPLKPGESFIITQEAANHADHSKYGGLIDTSLSEFETWAGNPQRVNPDVPDLEYVFWSGYIVTMQWLNTVSGPGLCIYQPGKHLEFPTINTGVVGETTQRQVGKTQEYVRARAAVKSVNPSVKFGVYVGGWYASYYDVGVNWASPDYDTSSKFSWATKKYMDYGYADLMDQMLIGAYASPARVYGTTEWTMQGFCLLAKERTMGACPMVAGGPDVGNWDADDKVPQEEENRAITASVAACINACDGYFLFDMIHLKKADQWSYVKTGIDGVIKKD